MTDNNASTYRHDRDPARMKKTLQQAQTAAFTTQLFYFTMKILFCYILFKYHNTLTDSLFKIAAYVVILLINIYLILTLGKDPGYESPTSTIHNQQQQINGFISQDADNYCDICHCRKKLRTKHCFRCGRCVRKFDHHCPWIGACVGERNHLAFYYSVYIQLLDCTSVIIKCFGSMQLYEYRQGNDSYSQEFGVFAIFSIFMFLYILFVGTLLFFHSYLIITNYTTTQLTKRGHAKYLRGVKGNPFSRGIFTNLWLGWNIPAQGHEWIIQSKENAGRQRTWIQKVWSNQYYDCC